jgi:general L-amino acid transport system permease protein
MAPLGSGRIHTAHPDVASGKDGALKTPRALRWVRKNLFATPFDAMLTIAVLALIVWVAPPALDWLIFKAQLAGTSRDACSPDGACWVFVKERLPQFLYGFYPDGQLWRVNLTGAVFFAAVVPLMFQRFPYKKMVALFLLTLFPVFAFVMLTGGFFGLEAVETTRFGGLMLTLVIAVVGIVGSLPLGIVLALGRRSEMPVVRKVCISFIELWRGVPLITVLFMASVMLPLFLPEGMTFNKLLRALIGVMLFSAAYMAEVVRGGLQAIPKGQYEAAAALGLGYWQSMGLIVLPQALKKVIPGIVNTFIGLFKDTTLVLIIGMFDLLGMVQTASTDPEWLGFSMEGYVFAGALFWVFCFTMSRYSQKLEKQLDRERRV